MSDPASTIIGEGARSDHSVDVSGFLKAVGAFDGDIDENYSSKDFYSHLVSNHLNVFSIGPGRITCFLTVVPAFTNVFNGLHGGAVAAFSERVAIACARTVVPEDKEIFLGELAMSYLSAAQLNEEVAVHGSVVRSGRNITVIAIEFKIRETGKLVYTSRATIYHMPASKL
ncbi:hypothetical protein ACFE04_019026 [Oxalis oulophora]